MPRRKGIQKRELTADPRYNSVLVQQFVNYLMTNGKKSTAESVFFGAMDQIQEKTGQDPMSVFKQALNNVKPTLEVASRRVGGATYQVPIEVRPVRRTALAMRWIIGFARQRREHSMAEKLAAELMLAQKNEGPSVKKREDTHKMAEANKAFAHYRW
ncbi:MAG: 30S ribosomal protein S7 [Candidatus Latescibacterota bacterium]|nr:MAG: 30S ribosomal protein S7 [Candidatus Latescibacterota bacterium]